MRQIAESINKMSNREYLDKMKEALAYCREHKLMSREERENPDWQKAAFQAIMRMELDKSSEWPMERIRAALMMIDKKINRMSKEEYREKTKDALAYCREHNLMTKEQWANPDQHDLAYKAVVEMEMDKLRHSAPEQNENSKP